MAEIPAAIPTTDLSKETGALDIRETSMKISAVTASGKTEGSEAKSSIQKPKIPRISQMVSTALADLKERKGSSVEAITEYISSHFPVDASKLRRNVSRYLAGAVTSGSVLQVKGKGAEGSFKMAAQKKKASRSKSPRTRKPSGKSNKTGKRGRPKKSTSGKSKARKSALRKQGGKKSPKK